ncbi:MAG: DUF3857 domain-containing transglutaminase family protein [Thalassotalea sp.]
MSYRINRLIRHGFSALSLFFTLGFCFSFQIANAQATNQDNTEAVINPAVNSQQAAGSQARKVIIAPTPDWVRRRNISFTDAIPKGEISEGIYYRLLDTQIKVEPQEEKAHYARYIETLVNKAGVDANSQLNLAYDPSYQKLVIHQLILHRDGQQIDKLATAKISVFDSETDLKKQLYHGELTVNILIDDLREGDSLDYSYSRYGSNPVYQNLFAYQRNVNWSVPVQRQFIRVLWGKDDPLYVTKRNFNSTVAVNPLGEYQEYSVSLHKAKPREIASQSPSWHDPYGQVFFSETKNWAAVVNWALPLYQFGKPHADIEKIAAGIRVQTLNSKEQIRLALNYAQNEIRYVGLEMGVNSHLPTPAFETVKLRYGDCKDKAVLFIEILAALHIDAFPVLVDTQNTKLLKELPPAINLFNHVMVTLELAGERYWLDPTMGYQKGALDTIYQPDYGYGLILKKGQSQLTSMAQTAPKSFSKIVEKYHLVSDITKTIKFSVLSEYSGDQAMYKEQDLDADGIKEITASYENYYQGTYNKLRSTGDVIVSRDQQAGKVKLHEFYLIDDIWSKESEGHEIEFYPNEVRNALFKPSKVVRDDPLALKYPNNIINVIEINFQEDDWSFDDAEFSQENDYFSYQSSVVFKDNKLTLSFQYTAKSDHIPFDKIEQYLAARDKVRENAYYGIIRRFPEESLLDSFNKLLQKDIETAADKAKENKAEVDKNLATTAAESKLSENLASEDKINSARLNDLANATNTTAPNSESEPDTTANVERSATEIAKVVAVKHQKNQQVFYWFYFGLVIYLLLLILLIVSWRKKLSQQRLNNKAAFTQRTFYAVGAFKFIVLSITSLGIYPSYWAYRNWQALQQQDNLTITPLFRAYLSSISYFLLFKALKNNSNKSTLNNRLPPLWLAAIFAVLNLVPIILLSLQQYQLALLALAATSFLYIPLVDYVANASASTDLNSLLQTPELITMATTTTKYQHNAWCFHHSLLLILFIPSMSFLFAKQFYLLPNQQIVTAEKVLPSDIKFLKQQGLIAGPDKLISFYSDDYLSMKNDGAGYSDNRVFAYWFNEANQLVKNSVPFADVSKITVDFADADHEFTVVTVYPKSADSFLLFVPRTNKQDLVFVKEMKKRWHEKYFVQTSVAQKNTEK